MLSAAFDIVAKIEHGTGGAPVSWWAEERVRQKDNMQRGGGGIEGGGDA